RYNHPVARPLRYSEPERVSLRDLHLGREVVRGVENVCRVAEGRPCDFPGPRELAATGSEARTRRDDTGYHRGVKRQHLVLGDFDPEQILKLLELLRVPGGDVIELCPVLGKIVQFIWVAAGFWGVEPATSHGSRMTLVLAVQPSW